LGAGLGDGLGEGTGVGVGLGAALLLPPHPATTSRVENTEMRASALNAGAKVIRIVTSKKDKLGRYGVIYSACIGLTPICPGKAS